jgi:diguanylate cyclase (GGDEF)-like protein/PAS domain S-box-containing protein
VLKPVFEALKQQVGSTSFSCEAVDQGSYYEEVVQVASESDLLRIFIVDITERKTAEAARILAEKKYRSIFENAAEGIFQSTLEGQYLTVNPTLARIYGYSSPEEMVQSIQTGNSQLYVDFKRRQQFIKTILAEGYVYNFESQIRRQDGTIIWVLENVRLVYDENGQGIGFEGSVQDITTRKLAEIELQKRDHMLRAMSQVANNLLVNLNFQEAIINSLQIIGEALQANYLVLCKINLDDDLTQEYLSLEFEWFSDRAAVIVTNQFWAQLPSQKLGITSWLRALESGEPVTVNLQKASQTEGFFLEASGIQSLILVPIFVVDKLWGFWGIADCNESRIWEHQEEFALSTVAASIGGAIHRQQIEDAIRHRALHDALTSLPNRLLFNEQLDFALKNAERSHSMLAVMFLDLDRFKIINDTLGHTIGDGLLQQVAQRLTEVVRGGDVVARWGGDEFIILIPHFSEKNDMHTLAERILQALNQVFIVEENELYVTSSIGIAFFDSTKPDAENLIKRADIALYHVKEQGRNGYQIFDKSMDSRIPEILALEKDLRKALGKGEFQILYQPRINLADGTIDGMEALLRWQHPKMGLVTPNKFIPIAEDTGLILSIGEWVLNQACLQNKLWQDAGLAPIRIAVNLSPKQFRQSNLIGMVKTALEQTGLDPAYLELEITENVAIQDIEFTQEIFERLSEMGVLLSIDDFGTGHSSLSRLQNLPINYLKIDKSFVQNLDLNQKVSHIIKTIVALGKNLGLKIVAEGVETEIQLKFLKSIQCETAQGFFFYRPIAVEAATHLLYEAKKKNREICR